MTEQKTDRKFPEPEAFANWVRRALADLRMRPSEFLVDEGKPGSVNRVAAILKNPSSVKLSMARRLEAELLEEARRQGKDLLPLLPEEYPVKKKSAA